MIMTVEDKDVVFRFTPAEIECLDDFVYEARQRMADYDEGDEEGHVVEEFYAKLEEAKRG